MFNLDDSGDITIDITVPNAEDPQAEPSVVKVVVAPPPTFGAYKRIRSEIGRINKGRDALTTELQNDDTVGPQEMVARINEFIEDGLMGWWKLVMVGDDSYRGQATGDVPDPEHWPLYLVTNEAMSEALSHWKTVPLARGAKPAPQTN